MRTELKKKGRSPVGKGELVSVLGLGLSGRAAVELLVARGCRVAALDDSDTPETRVGTRDLESPDVAVRLGAGELPEGTGLLVVSPGVPGSHPLIAAALAAGIPVRDETELAWRFLQLPLSAVTGTNGKTTTVQLLARMLSAAGRPARAAGNVGYPLSRLALDPQGIAEPVVELSSFQLERLETIRPRVAVFLNFAPDHLDRHPDPETYFRAKARIFSRQRRGDVAVIPSGLARLLEGFIPRGVRLITFGGPAADLRPAPEGVWTGLTDPPGILIPRSLVGIPGEHNLLNIMAAAGAALARGASAAAVAAGVEGFVLEPHRLEVVGIIAGVTLVNDSKATNPHAAAAALASCPGPLVWIAGGSDKKADFTPLRALLPGRVKQAVFLGQVAPRLLEDLGDLVPCVRADGLSQALDAALQAAGPGETIILSPGAASYDMFKNYRDRGDRFRALVAARTVPGQDPGAPGKEGL